MADQTKREIRKLTSELAGAGDVELRRSAVHRLGDIGFAQRLSLEKRGTLAHTAETALSAEQLDALHAAMRDGDREVRLRAIGSIGDFGDGRSVGALVEALGERDEDVRLAAIDSLGDIGGAEAVGALTRLAGAEHEDETIRLAALAAIEELSAKRITSGPDRRYDPPEAADEQPSDADEPDDVAVAKTVLREVLDEIRDEPEVDQLLRLKAGDIRSYLDSGAG